MSTASKIITVSTLVIATLSFVLAIGVNPGQNLNAANTDVNKNSDVLTNSLRENPRSL